jgi:hypothetical protein
MAWCHQSDTLLLEIIFWYKYGNTGSHYYVRQRTFYENLYLTPLTLCVSVT